jgi:predicted permease
LAALWIYEAVPLPYAILPNVLLYSTDPAVVLTPHLKMVGWYALGVALFAAIGTFLFVRRSKRNSGNQAY